MTQIDKNIAYNLKRIRKSRNMSLDMLAEQTGVSKSMLGQIERGESNPTVTTIGRIVEGLRISFEQLLYHNHETIAIPSMEQAAPCREQEGEYSVRILLPFDAGRNFEIYQASLEKDAVLESSSHGEDTWEYLTVLEGEIELLVNEECFRLPENAAFYFACDRDHSYRNTGEKSAVFSMLITRERR